MKILHVITTLDPAAGGPPAVVTRLAAAQAALGHEIHIASYQSPSAADRIAAYWKTIPNHQLVRSHPIVSNGRIERFTARAAAGELDGLIPSMDMIHLHGVWDPILKSAAEIAQRVRVAYVVAPHGMLDPWSMHQRRLKKQIALLLGYRRMLDRAAFLHVLNADERDLLEPRDLNPRRQVIPNGIFLEELEPMPARDAFQQYRCELAGKPYVLFLSRLHYKKGLDFLADAFAICAGSNAELQLVVAGPDDGAQADFQQRIERAGLVSRVHIVGPLYGLEKIAALRGASVFCLPSRQEGFSMAIAEAMACETPVVVSKDCHFPEVAEVKAGFVVNLDPQAITRGILSIVNDPHMAKEMGKSGRQLIESRFTWPRVAERSIEAYQSALGSK